MTSANLNGPWETVEFRERFITSLPGDAVQGPEGRQVRAAMYSFVDPTPVSSPTIIAYSPDVADSLGITEQMLTRPQGAEILAGNLVLPNMRPYAACYGGHQFGNWAGQLGDGRAISLGEIQGTAGQTLELQLKGAGPTPYSRGADGRAVMRSSVREFLMSEAMFYLGIPTTRALSLVKTGDLVNRDMLYDGNPKDELGAIVCRVAPSFLRFGSYEIFTARRDHENLKLLADFTIREFFPELGAPNPDTYLAWIAEVARRTAKLMAHWMRVGFVHGVMNTDNMSVLGLTIDYGPYGWIDNYDPLWTPNTTDATGRRYRFGHQPQVGLWNLECFANALLPLLESKTLMEQAVDEYVKTYEQEQSDAYRRKLGLCTFRGEEDIELFQGLFNILKATETDMTIFFRNLSKVNLEGENTDKSLLEPLLTAYYKTPSQAIQEQLQDWLLAYRKRWQEEKQTAEQRKKIMNEANPKYVLRNYIAQQAIDKIDEGDPSLIHELLKVLKHPYDEQPEHEHLFAKRPEWARHRAGCSMLSCSS